MMLKISLQTETTNKIRHLLYYSRFIFFSSYFIKLRDFIIMEMKISSLCPFAIKYSVCSTLRKTFVPKFRHHFKKFSSTNSNNTRKTQNTAKLFGKTFINSLHIEHILCSSSFFDMLCWYYTWTPSSCSSVLFVGGNPIKRRTERKGRERKTFFFIFSGERKHWSTKLSVL